MAVDEQDGAGETLPERISKLRGMLLGHAAAETFEDALLEASWLDAEEEKHRSAGFLGKRPTLERIDVLRRRSSWLKRDDFPDQMILWRE